MRLSAQNSAWYVTGNERNAARDGDGDEDPWGPRRALT